MSPVRPTLDHEARLWRSGHRWVAGLDEVGRGAWAGPLTVGVVVVAPGSPAGRLPDWLRDSKQLAEGRREQAFTEITGWCADAAVGHASPAECDRYGMSAALRLAAYRAIEGLECGPEALIVDGPHNLLRRAEPRTRRRSGATRDHQGSFDGLDPDVKGPEHQAITPSPDVERALPAVELPATVETLVGADASCAAVAAASVVAKVVRDRMMRVEAEHFPAYSFERNKGYPSPVHQMALRGYGLSAIHRRSWSFVAGLPWR